MADPFLTDAAIMGSSPEASDIQRQRKLAELLTANSFTQPQGQMISGHYVAPSWTQQLAPLASALAGSHLGSNIDKKQEALAQQLRSQKSEAYTQFQTLMSDPATRSEAMKFAAGNQFLQPMYQDFMKPQKLAAEENLVLPNVGGNAPINLASGGAKLAPEVRQAMQMLGINKDVAQLNSQELQAVNAKVMQLNQSKGTNISVNTGQHGFDNALKLRENFKSEPIYKGFTEVESANNQIKQAAAMKSPAGDLAAATKVMKILDPGSVVRESELGMAMQATGVEDRVKNYATMVLNGTKLTPSQRTDFVALAEKLTNAAGTQYNTKRAEYEQIAAANGLSVPASVPPAAKLNTPTNPPLGIAPSSLDAELKRRGLIK
jgi:hypothetical protein